MNRQNPIKEISEEAVEQTINLIEEKFQSKWLNNSISDHPLINTWNRKDWLATNELYTLGSCIKLINEIDQNWLEKQIVKAKSSNNNQVRGALFEILAIGYIASKSNIAPTKDNQSGYDAVINLRNDLDLRLSLKNYSLSYYQNNFQKEVEKFEPELLALLKHFKLNQIQIVIDEVVKS